MNLFCAGESLAKLFVRSLHSRRKEKEEAERRRAEAIKKEVKNLLERIRRQKRREGTMLTAEEEAMEKARLTG